MSASHPIDVQSLLSPYVGTFCLSFVVSLALTPAMSAIAVRFGITDAPDRNRKLHRRPMPYLGGVAMFVAWACGMAIQFLLRQHFGPTEAAYTKTVLWGIVGGAATAAAIGLWDDVRGLKPGAKIAGQVLATAFLWASGLGAQSARPALVWAANAAAWALHLPDPFAHGAPPGFDTIVRATSLAFVLLAVVGCCNAMNLMDGLDGLCGGVATVIMAGFLVLSVHLAGSGIDRNGDAVRLALMLAVLGAVLGFLPFNFSPAIIFMGDAGSMFLGFCCATGIVLLAEADAEWFLAALVIFALPASDTSLAILRRRIAGRPIFAADRRHFHHQLLERGLTVRQAVLVSYGLGLAFAFLGAAMIYIRCRFALALYLVVFSSIAVGAYKIGMFHESAAPARRRRRRRRAPHRAAERLSTEEVETLLRSIPDRRFSELVEFVWRTGCRGTDAFRIRMEHVDQAGRCVRLPATWRPRRGSALIRLDDSTSRLIGPLLVNRMEGPLFRDQFGNSWTKESVVAHFSPVDHTFRRRHSLGLIRRSRSVSRAGEPSGLMGLNLGLDHDAMDIPENASAV
jgi:UDP-GlcNAc:undecaprenyl-phosphate GlcNAc-1-phosphate transferase